MDFLFSGKLSENQNLIQKKMAIESINNLPNKAIKVSKKLINRIQPEIY